MMLEPRLDRDAGPTLGSDRYDLVEQIGEGSVGVVYRAYDRLEERMVALKTLREWQPDALAELKAEFRARREIFHPNLLPLFDLEATTAGAYLTMELVQGPSLERWIRQGEAASATPRTPRQGEPHPGTALDLDQMERLVVAGVHIVRGLTAMHEVGFVHRDVKPQNLFVDDAAQVLVGDFGLALSWQDRSATDPTTRVSGTLGYIAPECLRGATPSTASDLYAVGIVLKEILTGRPPLPAWHADPTVPTWVDGRLASLVRRLVTDVPSERASADEALEILERIVGKPRGASAEPSGVWGFRQRLRRDPFVGRTQALASLRHSYREAASADHAVVLHVAGASGIGKTTAVRRFLEEVSSDADFMLLRGRCHLSERVPFCALDGVVDDLARALRRTGAPPSEVLEPFVARCAARLFPVLADLLPEGEQVGATTVDGAELRRAGFRGLGILLRHVSRGHRLVVWIDDLQWTDADSSDLLAELWSSGALAKTLVVLSYRMDDQAILPELQLLRAALDPGKGEGIPAACQRELRLSPLSEEEVGSLLEQWIPRGVLAGPVELAGMVKSSAGFPIFARELAYDAVRAAEDDCSLRAGTGLVEDLVNRRISELSRVERALIDAIALSPGHVSAQTVASAIGATTVTREIASLVDRAILREAPGRGSLCVAPYHDSIREARLREMSREDRIRLHHDLAEAFEAHEPANFEVLSHHWEQGGDRIRSGEYAARAAERAFHNLAFASAIEHYGRALEHLRAPRTALDLTARLAESYANLGLADDAARTFASAARLASSEGDTVRYVEMQRRAAAELFHSGQIVDGYRLMRNVMRLWGRRLPNSFWGCIARSTLARSRLILRGTGYRARPESDIPPAEVVRADTLWTTCTSLAHVNHALADVFLQEHLVAALALGEPSRIMRALTYEAAAEATYGGRFFDRRSDRLLGQAAQILETVSSPYNRGWYWVAKASRDSFRADWGAVVDCCRRADEHLRQQAYGVQWERSVNFNYWTIALAMRGEARALAEVQKEAADEARARRDPLAENGCCSGHPAETWLFQDDEAAATSAVARAFGAARLQHAGVRLATTFPEDTFRTSDYFNLVAYVELCLYQGRVDEALGRITADWERLRNALLLQVQFVGVDLRFLFAKAILAALHHEGARSEAGGAIVPLGDVERARLGRTLEIQARALRRNANRLGRPYSDLIAAARPGVSQSTRAELLTRASAAFDEVGMRAYAAATRIRLGEALASEGRGIVDDAVGAMSTLGIVNPDRAAGFLVPALA